MAQAAIALASLLLFTFFDAGFLTPLATVFPFRAIFLPSRFAVCKKLLSDKESDTALALAPIAPSVLPIGIRHGNHESFVPSAFVRA